MTFPAWYDLTSDVVYGLRLVTLDTPDGLVRFMMNADATFIDIDGNAWTGCSLFAGGDDEYSVGGTAPSGQMSLTFFQDPGAADLVANVKAFGADYLAGRALVEWLQPIGCAEELTAPIVAPVKVMTRIMRKLSYSLNEDQTRSIILTYESRFEGRRSSRRRVWNEADHGALIGAANPSLRFVPQSFDNRQKLF
ncbi:hypothetical protein [Pseudooceanicola algae]|uniref:Uncharacterized protein n=1 Tax=Pseudooceanicola algae TaxID=1537215 RepID=A0A418SDC3_9RHOB|nr:hypothetical protein [Pseudooceanicola algae]QPM89387.1 hypothetical protein PSAL_006030 [Pseudooceanicola algae]